MKLYQNALKLHSQGPSFFDEAEIAYKALFGSEIFTYTESLSETQWLDLYAEHDAYDDGLEDDVDPAIIAPATSSEGAPSTLPQILYLAYKNHGHFRLDRLKAQLARIEHGLLSGDFCLSEADKNNAASAGLLHLAEALDRDGSDLELWRKVSRVSEFLGSERVARYCLEAVLDTDGSGVATRTESLGLEGHFAAAQLKPLLLSIDDHISEHQFRLLPGQQNSLVRSLHRHIDPYPFLPKRSRLSLLTSAQNSTKTKEIAVPIRSWTSVGRMVLNRIQQEAQGIVQTEPAANYYLKFPVKEIHEAVALSNQKPRQLDLSSEPKVISGVANQTISPRHASHGQSALGEAHASLLSSPTEVFADSIEHIETSPTTVMPQVNDSSLIHGLGIQGANTQAKFGEDEVEGNSIASLPNRKRSSDTAELQESIDIGRSRSKRIKAKGSLTDPIASKETAAEESSQWYEKQLQIYAQVDGLAFQATQSLLSKLACDPLCSAADLRRVVIDKVAAEEIQSVSPPQRPDDTVLHDLKDLLDGWDIGKSKLFLQGDGSEETSTTTTRAQNPGFSTFLEHSAGDMQTACQLPMLPDDIELEAFSRFTNGQDRHSIESLAFQWLCTILVRIHLTDSGTAERRFYEQYVWPDELKEIVVQMLVNQDEFIFSEMTRVKDEMDAANNSKASDEPWVAFVQIIFELHLDVYGRITNPSSEVELTIRTMQRDRLCRWASLSGEFLSSFRLIDGPANDRSEYGTQLSIRFLWASVVCNHLTDPTSNDFTIVCYRDMIRLLKLEMHRDVTDRFFIELPNNAVMPEISVDCAEKEISRLTTMEFFTSIFDSSNEDPFAVIHNLEPLLELSIYPNRSIIDDKIEGDEKASPAYSNQNSRPVQTAGDPRLRQTLQFLDQASLTFRLFLWQRLRDAYSVINYPPQIFACNLRSLALIVRYLVSPAYFEQPTEKRYDALLRWLHKIDDYMNQLLALALTDTTSFEYIDNDHLRSSIEVVALLQKIIHCFAMWEDSIRVGQLQPPAQGSNAGVKAQVKSADKFREMMVKSWTLQYLLGREAMAQFPNLFETPSEDLINYLKLAHQALGLRCYCSLANKVFLRLAKTESLRLKPCDGWDIDMPQVIFDLYGLKISSSASDVHDHVSAAADLDKQTALEIIDLVTLNVNRLSIKDLLKSDLKSTIDKMQQVIKVSKTNSLATARAFNRRIVLNYLKSPIKPVDLYQARKGLGGLCGMVAHTDGSAIAEKGWYFLLGHIALTKFRSQKRISPGSIEELENAKAFFKIDLEFDPEKWETWFRLAQAYDTTVDEMVTWTAEKLDNEMDRVADAQREAILCYTMALGIATRNAGASFEETSKLADLYYDFGTRIYASSREPFSMKAFSLEHYEKHYNGQARGMYKASPFTPLQTYQAWDFARFLLKRASVQKPQEWQTYYMLGKVLWKMHNCGQNVRRNATPSGYEAAIDAFVKAVRFLPEKRDNRHPDKDPILEPHYKLASVVHKLVHSHRLSSAGGCGILQATPYARRVPNAQASEQWEQYIEQVLKMLRAADKANWHHRMVARAAHTIYDSNRADNQNILGAKYELTQQIFTKTMTIQVWRPDNERSGRHFVYTSRYVRFFVRILDQLKDRESLEALARRIRKKAADFVDHFGVWEELTRAYLKLLRQSATVPPAFDEHVFKSADPEEFALDASRLEAWVHNPNVACEHLDDLRDAIEYKKLNGNLLKASEIEDLIADIYAKIYYKNVPDLKARETAEENRVRMRVDNILAAEPSGTDAPVTTDENGPKVDPMAQYKRKAASVTRREIIRKSEALMTKPPPIATPKPASRVIAPALESGKASNVTVVIREGPAREETSVPGSVDGSLHDSADDESELSEVEDVVDGEPAEEEIKEKADKRAPLIPNFFGVHSHTESDEAVGRGSDQGDDTVEEGPDKGHNVDDQQKNADVRPLQPISPSASEAHGNTVEAPGTDAVEA